MVTQPAFDTDFAKSVSAILGASMSNYAAAGHNLLNAISKLNYPWGTEHVDRDISVPFQDVMIDRRFTPPEQEMEKRIQSIDFGNVSKRLMIDNVDYAADTANANKHVSDSLSIMQDGLEKLLIEGADERVLLYGIADYPSGTAGTINRPEIAYTQTTTGDWETITNMQSDVAETVGGLIGKRFYGLKALLLPEIAKPLIANVMTNTAIPVSQWISGALGLPVIFSPFVDEDATREAFDAYVIDMSKVHLGMTDLRVDSFYSNKDHAYFWDMEIFVSPMYDPLHDGTEYLKGVGQMLARDWSD